MSLISNILQTQGQFETKFTLKYSSEEIATYALSLMNPLMTKMVPNFTLALSSHCSPFWIPSFSIFYSKVVVDNPKGMILDIVILVINKTNE